MPHLTSKSMRKLSLLSRKHQGSDADSPNASSLGSGLFSNNKISDRQSNVGRQQKSIKPGVQREALHPIDNRLVRCHRPNNKFFDFVQLASTSMRFGLGQVQS